MFRFQQAILIRFWQSLFLPREIEIQVPACVSGNQGLAGGHLQLALAAVQRRGLLCDAVDAPGLQRTSLLCNINASMLACFFLVLCVAVVLIEAFCHVAANSTNSEQRADMQSCCSFASRADCVLQ